MQKLRAGMRAFTLKASLLDRLVPATMTDAESRHRGRIVAGVSLLSVLLWLGSAVQLAHAVGPRHPAVPLLAAMGVVMGSALLVLRRSYDAAAALLVSTLLAGSVLLTLPLGGLSSPNLISLAAPAVLAALLGHRRMLVLVALGACLSLVALYVADPFLPRTLDPHPTESVLFARLVNVVSITVMAWLHESSRSRAAQQLKAETARREQMETELRLAHKLEAVGQLAAGIAHEINNPLQYVHDSVQFVGQSMPVLGAVLDGYRDVAQSVLAGNATDAKAREALQREADADVAFVLENAPDAVDLAQDGLERIAGIVRSLRQVDANGSEPRAEVDLNDTVRSTLTLAKSELENVAKLETDFGELPRVPCWGGEVTVALLAILVNAAHAVADAVTTGAQLGRIVVKTRRDGNDAVVTIADSGPGIPPAIQHRIFDPFFSTKGAGGGVGQGLSIARKVIVERHGGKLTFESEPGRGTTFNVRLPLAAHAA